VRAGGMTLRAVEALLEKELVSGGFFKNPQVTVAIEQYRSQKIHIVGEVRNPGSYVLSGDMRLVEALALAGSSTPMASGEVVIVHVDSTEAHRVDLRELEDGDLAQNVRLASGDTIFVQRAESVYLFGQVRNPGAYPFRQKKTTVLQALSLAGGVTDRGSTTRIQIVRVVDGEKKEIRVELDDLVEPRDTIIVPERFF
jgi:polysaccharide export outer membrane protein